jgi:hypothetical protein
MKISNDLIIYCVVFALSFVSFYAFWKIGVRRIAAIVVARPVFYITISLVIVALLGIGIKNLTLEPDMKVLLPPGMESVETFDKIESMFGGLRNRLLLHHGKGRHHLGPAYPVADPCHGQEDQDLPQRGQDPLHHRDEVHHEQQRHHGGLQHHPGG